MQERYEHAHERKKLGAEWQDERPRAALQPIDQRLKSREALVWLIDAVINQPLFRKPFPKLCVSRLHVDPVTGIVTNRTKSPHAAWFDVLKGAKCAVLLVA